MDESEIDEYAVGDREPLPFKWVRYARLKHPRGPFYDPWLFDQVVTGMVKSVVVIPRGKNHGVRLVDLESLLALVNRLAKEAGPPPKSPDTGWIR